MATKIHVAGIAPETTEQQIQELFGQHGTILSVLITEADSTGQTGSFAIVEMTNAADALKAIMRLHGKDFGGRKLTINQAKPQDNQQNSPHFASTPGGSLRR